MNKVSFKRNCCVDLRPFRKKFIRFSMIVDLFVNCSSPAVMPRSSWNSIGKQLVCSMHAGFRFFNFKFLLDFHWFSICLQTACLAPIFTNLLKNIPTTAGGSSRRFLYGIFASLTWPYAQFCYGKILHKLRKLSLEPIPQCRNFFEAFLGHITLGEEILYFAWTADLSVKSK